MKRDQWEGGHRVPFIVRWPGTVKPGRVAPQMISLTDVLATCASIVGADLPSDAAEDSFDILPVLTGGAGADEVRPFLLQQTDRQQRFSLRKGKWKYLDHKGSGGNDYNRWKGLDSYILPELDPDTPGQLYDMEADPCEATNLYSKNPKLVRELKFLLDRALYSGRSAPTRD